MAELNKESLEEYEYIKRHNDLGMNKGIIWEPVKYKLEVLKELSEVYQEIGTFKCNICEGIGHIE